MASRSACGINLKTKVAADISRRHFPDLKNFLPNQFSAD
jgi:hypothetical protein